MSNITVWFGDGGGGGGGVGEGEVIMSKPKKLWHILRFRLVATSPLEN